MKQKIVIKVNTNSVKSRTKFMKTAVSVAGVESVALGEQDNNQMEVTGVGIDAVKLTTKLRKKLGYAELVSVGAAGKKKEEPITVQGLPDLWHHNYGGWVPHYSTVYYSDQYRYDNPYSCAMM